MKDFMSLLFFVIITFSLAACQPQGKDSVISKKDSSFTLNGAGE